MILGLTHHIAVARRVLVANLRNKFVDKKTVDKRNYWVDFSKIEKVLKFRAKENLKHSIAEIAENIIVGKINIRDPKYSNYLQVLDSRKGTVNII